MTNPNASIDAANILTVAVPILAIVCGWLWRQIRANMDASNNNSRSIALIQQTLDTHKDKVGGMEEKVEKLSNEITQMKFSLQSLEHKQDKHHLEIIGKMDAMVNAISSH